VMYLKTRGGTLKKTRDGFLFFYDFFVASKWIYAKSFFPTKFLTDRACILRFGVIEARRQRWIQTVTKNIES